MTGEELLRDVFRRWNAGERELYAELFDPEFEVHSALTGRVYHGEAEVREWMAEIDEQFDGWELELGSVRPLADGRAMGWGKISAQGRGSGIELDQPAAWLIEVREGRLRSLHNFIGREAIAAAEASVV